MIYCNHRLVLQFHAWLYIWQSVQHTQCKDIFCCSHNRLAGTNHSTAKKTKLHRHELSQSRHFHRWIPDCFFMLIHFQVRQVHHPEQAQNCRNRHCLLFESGCFSHSLFRLSRSLFRVRLCNSNLGITNLVHKGRKVKLSCAIYKVFWTSLQSWWLAEIMDSSHLRWLHPGCLNHRTNCPSLSKKKICPDIGRIRGIVMGLSLFEPVRLLWVGSGFLRKLSLC